jgi:murein DD-endopeptidase MepM/ murein hydrolase activator NlpD
MIIKNLCSKIIIIIVILFISLSAFPDNEISGKFNPERISDIENEIIVKGIESDYENDLSNSEGTIIYDDSFAIINHKTNKKSISNDLAIKKKSEMSISDLQKKDNRWHNTSHKIKKGENLWSISRKYDTDYKLIIKFNEINKPDRLNPGNTVVVPNRTGVKHRISRNETLSQIAKIYKIQKDKIVSHNCIKNDKIITGKYIFIPDASEPEIRIVKSETKTYKKQVKNNSSQNSSFDTEDESEVEESEAISAARITENSRPVFIWPVNGEITSSFGKRMNPIDNKSKSRFHCGLDIRAEIGTPVKASADGETIFSGWKKGYGRVVILKHQDGYITVYAHNKNNTANTGDNIKQGDIVAFSGMSGAVTGPHLHFEIRKYLTPLNPARFIR